MAALNRVAEAREKVHGAIDAQRSRSRRSVGAEEDLTPSRGILRGMFAYC